MSIYTDLSEIKETNELLRSVIEGYLNIDYPALFNISLVEKTDEEKWSNENLVYDESIHGVINVNNTNVLDESSVSKDILMKVLVPFKEIDGLNLMDIGQSALENALINLNRKQVTIDNGKRIVFNNITLSDGAKLGKQIRGVEYELFNMTFNVAITKTLISSEVQYVSFKIGDEYIKMGGIFNIGEETSNTMDGGVNANGGMNSYCASKQTALSIDFFVYEGNTIHKMLYNEKKQNKTYDIKYYDGLVVNEMKVKIAKLYKKGTWGACVQAGVTLIEKERRS